MKLTRHERKIISKINKGEVYDIPSYLRLFGKGKEQTYDIDAIRSKFIEEENGKRYKVLKDGHSLLISTHTTQQIMGQTYHMPISILRNEIDITEDERTLCEAQLDNKIPTSVFTYDNKEFRIDFQKGAFVADDFKDILTFIRLWSYLRHENLVFEVNRPITQEEISMLYELVPCNKKRCSPQIRIEWDKNPDKEKAVEQLKPVKEIYQTVPIRKATDFMDVEWKMNEDHLMMCREFLGKKMYPTGASHNFAANGYHTPEERHRSLNTVIALVALFISVLSFSYNLLYPSDTYKSDLDNITHQLYEIQTKLEYVSEYELSEDEIVQSYEDVESIEDGFTNEESNTLYSENEEHNIDVDKN